MPRSKTRALIRAAARTARENAGETDHDSGRTPARVDYVRREIRRRLGLRDEVKARQAARLGEDP
jgi:hypothetical protein